MEQRVSIARCGTYEIEPLKAALRAAVRNIGGFEAYIPKGSRVLIKVNLITGKKAEEHATTHPAFARALAELLQEYGARVVIGDSPGGLFNSAALHSVYRTTGYQKMAEEAGLLLNENTDVFETDNPEGRYMKRLTMTAMLRDADYVVSACKLKTHTMMTYTGAVKNMFGTIPGTVKADYHVRMPKEDDFADVLLDICLAAKPALSFMDAVTGMEGNGPTAGTPRDIGAVLASPSPHALDLVACRMIGLGAELVPTLRRAVSRGLLDPDEVITCGEDPAAFFIPDYRLPDHIQSDLLRLHLPNWLADSISRVARAKVRFDETKCVRCGICKNHCPAKAITMTDRGPKADYKRCIRCFCCQELCPREAVTVRESAVFRLLNRL